MGVIKSHGHQCPCLARVWGLDLQPGSLRCTPSSPASSGPVAFQEFPVT